MYSPFINLVAHNLKRLYTPHPTTSHRIASHYSRKESATLSSNGNRNRRRR